MKSCKKLRIHADLVQPDWFTFNQIFTPLLTPNSSNLYMSLYFQKQINQQLNFTHIEFNKFLENYKYSEEEFNTYFKELEKLGLVRIFLKKDINENYELIIKLESVNSFKEWFKNETINKKLFKTLTKEKYLELQLITQEDSFDYELSISGGLNKEEKIKESILSDDIYFRFYNGVSKLLGCEFNLSDEVQELIRKYYVQQQSISLEKLQQFAYLSTEEKNKKYSIVLDNFLFLINQELQKSNQKIDIEKYDNFWKELLWMDDLKIKMSFEELFSTCKCEDLYKLLTGKSKVPATLNKWIRDCVQNKGFSFPLLNATLSFVQTLLKKIPVNYLIKLSQTLMENEDLKQDKFIEYIKKVIIHDSENKNRIDLKNRENKLLENKEEGNQFTIYYRKN